MKKLGDILTKTLLGVVLIPVRTVFAPSRTRRRAHQPAAARPAPTNAG